MMTPLLVFFLVLGVPVLLLVAMVFGVDLLAQLRGLEGARPFSPAVAITLLIWVALSCLWLTYLLTQMNPGASQ